jgi:hypothetical protein
MRDKQLPSIKNKHDIKTVQIIAKLGYPTIQPILPYLLSWIQDLNWPVAEPLQRLFLSIGEPIYPFIKNIFRTDDDDWKFSCLIMLRNLSNEQLLNFKDELNLLATEPTPGEIASGTDTEANELLKRIL